MVLDIVSPAESLAAENLAVGIEYRVRLSAQSQGKAELYVIANSKEEAREKALALGRRGDVDWRYGGIDETSIELTDVLL